MIAARPSSHAFHLLLRCLTLLGLLTSTLHLRAQQPAVGLHYGSDFSTSQYEAFGSWLGRKVMYRVVFLDKTSWTTIAQAAIVGPSKTWVNSAAGRVDVITVPMFANGDTGGFASITGGSRDSAFRSLAAKIQAAGIAEKIIIRLAWEANGNWYSWSYQKDPAGFKAAYRRIVSVMRAAAPKLRFEFNISNLATHTGGAKWTAGYPGDDVVDVISMDIYDHWNTWSTMVNGDAGLNEMREFAKAHNKLEAYPEWACVTNANGHGDNPTFVRAMKSWMDARPGKVLYQSYWNSTGGGLVFSTVDAVLPNASDTYEELFGAPVAATAANTAPTISAIADRVIKVNGSSGPIGFTIGDAQTAAGSLKVTSSVSDPSLIPLSRVALGGTGPNRTVTITPVSNKTGWSTVWLKVSDGQLTKTISFVVDVSAALTFADVGAPQIAGGHSYQNGAFTVRAGGYDIYNKSDQFHFGQLPLTGDAELTMRLASLTNTNEWTKAGLMFRSSLAPDSAYAGVFVTAAKGVVLQWRTQTGAYASSSSSLPGRAPKWLRLLRSGDSFFAFCSDDGVDWDLVETVNVNLADTARCGLALVSHAPNLTATAVCERFSID